MVACAIACAIGGSYLTRLEIWQRLYIKRNYNIKDYGHLIQDTEVSWIMDSMIFTAPAIYFAVTFKIVR